ncbi:MAG: ABC transporter permease [Thermoplasmata archaeon]
MATYIVRRCLQIIPVLIGVVTITFLLFTALPISDQILAHYGTAGPHAPCQYNPSCPCEQLNKPSVHMGQCQCLDPPVTVTPATLCANPVYVNDVKALGLDKPLPVQWLNYVYHSFTFHWGYVQNYSYIGENIEGIKGQPVATVLAGFLPYTMELAMLSLGLILVIAIPLGNAAAVNRNRPLDQAARVMSFSGYAIPSFLLGSLLVAGVVLLLIPHVGSFVRTPWCPGGEAIIHEFQYSWPTNPTCYTGLVFPYHYPTWMKYGTSTTPTGFPTVDALLHHQYWLALDSLIRMLIPALVIAYGTIAGLLRFVRNSMLEVMNLDYIRTARAKGVPEKIVTSRHAGRNSLNVTITVLGLTFAGFIGGFPVVEEIFHINGVGEIIALAIQQNLDFAMIFGSTILFTFLVVAANIIVDVLYAYLDPRVRLG